MDVPDWRSRDLVAGDCPLSRTLEIVGGRWNAMIIVRRDEQPGTPARVEYALTGRGVSLRPVLAAMWRWGVRDEASWSAAAG
ncbi:transcriptional regulator, HxlR family [Micromonospora eburnea]|uniref:Transcriptional regulator, HxlR family n=2 Tax=Micromonospora eburnea TaxID=227316 RepID=A0A1C6UNJ3_9ACTN|nr:transcriptional regulator, HxlR family [Micromonospora eburnea]